jgi:hypothetical protein
MGHSLHPLGPLTQSGPQSIKSGYLSQNSNGKINDERQESDLIFSIVILGRQGDQHLISHLWGY